MKFKLVSNFKPAGDQGKAIKQLVDGLKSGYKYQTLLGVTGSGKTFTMANIINEIQKPALIISHNKTLAAQLYREFKEFFPDNAVEYFVSYYDYYQPEAYVPQRDLYIEKDASINDEIERLRLSTTASLVDRRDTIVVASVSCIYGLGSPEDYRELVLFYKVGMNIPQRDIAKSLVELQYERNDDTLPPGSFRIMGDSIEIHPAYARFIIRIDMFGDEIDGICYVDPINRNIIEKLERVVIYPAKHFLTRREKLEIALKNIEEELKERYDFFKKQGKLLEAQRIKTRTEFDLEMLREIGYCKGIENYSRHLSFRKPGERPACLLDYFPKDDFIVFIDESHVSVPQIRGMFAGDRSRKQTLVDYGFRLPSALDNRPLYLEEFESIAPQIIFVSATPGEYERKKSSQIVEQIIRPTGLVDPQISVRKTEGQMDDLIAEIKKRVKRNERTLITTLTKIMAEDLTYYLKEHNIKVEYLHSEIETIKRVEIIRDLRAGKYDVVVGINLLREGLDIPEVSLVAILDADKIGFLRSATALIQTIGRAARNVNGFVIMYADNISDAMKEAIAETQRRRRLQIEYNKKHNIKPKTIKKKLQDILERKFEKINTIENDIEKLKEIKAKLKGNKTKLIEELEKLMYEAAQRLDFETAIIIRDEINKIKKKKLK